MKRITLTVVVPNKDVKAIVGAAKKLLPTWTVKAEDPEKYKRHIPKEIRPLINPNPGSDEALNQGCRCPVLDNRHGLGAFDGKNGDYWINKDCPLHGSKSKKEEE